MKSRIAPARRCDKAPIVKASDLRGILNYVPAFRDKIFVISLDSVVLSDDKLSNLFLDISVLRSLNIKIVLVHGAAVQIARLAERLSAQVSNTSGRGITDAATLEVALMASSRLSQEILEGLTDNDLRGAITNAVIAHPMGIVGGKDMHFTGKVERIDVKFLEELLAQGIVPVQPPIGFDGDGKAFRVHSDGVATEIAIALRAAKLIFLTTSNGVMKNGRWITQMSIEEANDHLKKHKSELDEEIAYKLEQGIRACRGGVSRAHILDGREDEALLAEIFSNDGVGTMIHANEYTSIRKAMKKDLGAIMNLIHPMVESEELATWSRQAIVDRLGEFYVFVIDRNIVGCVAITILQQDPKMAEMGCLCVSAGHENQGVGIKLMQFSEDRSRELGVKKLFALSTNAFNYLEKKGNFTPGSPEMLPLERLEKYNKSKRNSRIFVKDFTA